MNSKAVLLVLATFFIAAVALPGAAQAGFSSNELDVSGGAGDNEAVASAVDANGNTLVAWTHVASPGDGEQLKLRRIKPDGSMGPVIDGSGTGNFIDGVKILFDSNNRALVAYNGSTAAFNSAYLRAFWVEPDDHLTSTVTVAGDPANGSIPKDFTVAVTSTNDAVFAWRNASAIISQQDKIQVQRFLADSTLPAQLDPGTDAHSVSPQLAPDSTGGALLTWRNLATITFTRVNPDNTIGPGVYDQVSTANKGPQLASDGDNAFQALFVAGFGPQSLQVRTLTNTGLSFPALTLSPDGDATDLVSSFDVDTNPDALSLNAWSRGNGLNDGVGDIVAARFEDPDRTLRPDTISAPDPTVNQTSPQIAIDSAGDGALVWSQSKLTGPKINWGRVIPATGTIPAPVRLSTTDDDTTPPEVELGANGIGISTWGRSSGATSTIVARQILPVPTCQTASANVVQGAPVVIDLTCVGVQLIDPEIATAPAHGTAKPVGGKAQQIRYTSTPGYAGPDSFTFKGANPGGSGAPVTVSLTVGKDTVKPSIRKLKAKVKGKKTTIRIGFSEPATATLRFERKAGRKYKKFGSLKTGKSATSAKLTLKGKIKKKKLKPGKYRITAVATDLAGNRSKAKRTTFRISASRHGR